MTDSESATLFEVDKGIATITLNRADNKNALSADLVDSLGDHLTDALDRDDVRVIVLTNVGNTFCAGADLKAAQPGVTNVSPRHTFIGLFEMIIESPKPVIGAIKGHITGGGVGLAAVCDISVMPTSAICGFTEVRIGVAPAVISVVCLPKLRPGDALELFLTGERIPAERAADVGLINHAVPDDEFDAKVEELVGKVSRGGPNALAASKQLVAKVPGMARDEAFAWTGELSQSLFKAEEAREGIAAFRERRDAPWITG